MHCRGVPKEYTNWIGRKMKGRKMVITFDNFQSETINIDNGCDQGCLLSAICYNFYNAGLLEVANPRKQELATGFIDDVAFLKAAQSFKVPALVSKA
ncbi:hypothetical protein K439DRAFT_1362900 [Ramaria rubella]|nr:hypothetical protein K439DRAFT_1362900 [Ramaria rubella]